MYNSFSFVKSYSRNELGLWFTVGNAGVVVVNGVVVDWWLGLTISAWWWLELADLGVVAAWACRSRRGGGLGLPILRISAWVCRSRPRLAFSLPSLSGVRFELWMILNGISLVSG
uniref:Uncharacterized protein n=1 Tax=Fagus sylvatica TaxID=28930 RepID=A0A2N9FQH3_FAGSY